MNVSISRHQTINCMLFNSPIYVGFNFAMNVIPNCFVISFIKYTQHLFKVI